MASDDEALGIAGAIIGGLIGALTKALQDLEELKADLKKRPTVDGSASDDEATATAADMPEDPGK